MRDGRQKSRASVNWRGHVVKIEVRIAAGQIDVGFVERFDRSQILPVVVEEVAIDIVLLNGARNDLITEIDHRRVRQQIREHIEFEKVNTHRRDIRTLLRLLPASVPGRCVRLHLPQRVALWLFAELFDAAIVRSSFSNPKLDAADSLFGMTQMVTSAPRLPVAFEQLAIIHPV